MLNEKNRIETLDTLRGLASFQVVLSHALYLKPVIEQVHHVSSTNGFDLPVILFSFTPLHTFWAAQEAVMLFFVLSGFVLSIPFYKKDRLEYGKFFVRRMFRIYGPYLVTLGIGYICLTIFMDVYTNGFSDWFNRIWSRPLSGADWLQLLTMGDADYHNIVTSLWTLPIEVKISLALPFIVMLLKRLNLAGCFAVLLLSSAAYYAGRALGIEEKFPAFHMLFYLFFFVLGAMGYKYKDRCLTLINRLSKKGIVFSYLICLVLYTWLWNLPLLPPQIRYYAEKLPGGYIVGFSAIVLIFLSISQKAPRFFENRYLIFLGRISFSLYMIHPIVIGVLGHLIGTAVPFPLLVVLIVITSLIVSVPFFNLVELPLQVMGRKLSDRLSAKKAPAGNVQ